MNSQSTVKDISDEDLISAIVKTNNTLLFEILYDRYAGMVFNKCLGFAKDYEEAQDLTQDVFLKLFVKLASFKGKSKFSTWLYAFTYNHCVNYVTRNKEKKIQKKTIEAKDIENLSEKEADHSIHQLKVEKLKKVLNLISPNEKMILLLKYQDNLSIREISEALDLGESAVKMRLKRAKEKLITVYQKHYENG
ncbi:sigma-70 family RNA polymerase sigma factor [Ichthyenterobacterium sp. W332]|uniref:Sigma-70 family RNA polymerase sigma factor n=1 Tax=Microcosmobacter mediterraneus TaxID=3075607 RepID=A0ABU2YKS0_9FLAO|nr:sigma-70 family RNA polymerase sigma factor [Ichthyenterobacterium sp. W332]MDT0558753.1 sigma-70 family RNA polymerase sigma factor [Ichthyenterobacterium sp. W332]